jgi:DNA adenine methylase
MQAAALSNWPGAKNGAGVYQQIISAMPPHRVYIEPFLGTGAVVRRKKPAGSSIVIDADPAVVDAFDHSAVPGCTVICGDGIRFLAKYPWQGDELVYADPPYLKRVRSCKDDYYRHELTEADHRSLLAIVVGVRSRVMISGYWSELYGQALADWRTISFWTTKRNGERVQEWLWCNFPEPFELHDYRYLGRNFRERERIKRKKDRWTRRIVAMPAWERGAVLDAIADARASFGSTIAGSGGQSSRWSSADPSHEIL